MNILLSIALLLAPHMALANDPGESFQQTRLEQEKEESLELKHSVEFYITDIYLALIRHMTLLKKHDSQLQDIEERLIKLENKQQN